MSLFDRLSNLGKGALKNAFSDDEPELADPLARQLERLRGAYASGVLTEAEYTRKRAALIGHSPAPAQATSFSRPASTVRPPRTPIDPPATEDPPADAGDWPETPAIKRTL